jgi:hypothetical protein
VTKDGNRCLCTFRAPLHGFWNVAVTLVRKKMAQWSNACFRLHKTFVASSNDIDWSESIKKDETQLDEEEDVVPVFLLK